MNDDLACAAADLLCEHGISADRMCGLCPDPCVVDSEPVAHIIAQFVSKWRAERPSLKNRRGTIDDDGVPPDAVEPVAPYTYLAIETGLAGSYARAAGRFWTDAAGRKVGTPSVEDVKRAENDIRKARNHTRNPNVELRVVDALVASIGEPSMFDDLTIRPNPKAPAHRHGECCGGSLT